jgi:hypothetical protein
MARTVFLIVITWLCFVLLREYGWAWFGFDDKFAWALLLPGVYVAGLAILND